MKPIEFVEILRQTVIDDNLSNYRELLEDKANSATNQNWKEMMNLYQSFSPSQKNIFFDFLRLLKVNTVSHIFGILDGSSYFSDSRDDFKLTSGMDSSLLNGDLQDIFLEMEET